MATVKQMAEMVGVKENQMQMFLDLMAVHMKAGASFEQAMDRTRLTLEKMAEQAALPESQQAEWFVAWRSALAVDVWHSIRRNHEMQMIFA